MSDFLRTPEADLTQGLDFSIPSISLPQGKNYPQNMQLYRGEMKKRDGRSVIGSVSIGAHPVNHLAVMELTNGIQRLIRITKRNVERYMAATGLWEDVTGLDLTGDDDDFFQSCMVSELDLFLFTNFIDAIRKYNDSGNAVDLGGTPPKAKAIEYLSPYVLIGNLVEGGNSYPQKVKWCDTGAPETWTGGNSGSQLLADEPSAIYSIKKLLNYAMVYKEKSVYRGIKSQNSATIFDFGGPFVDGKGLGSPRAIAGDGQNHYYMGNFDFHKNNGVRVTDIGAPVREYIFNRLNRSRLNTCHALHVELYKEIWFFITIGANDWPTEVWKYNYERDRWYYDSVVDCITAALYKQTVDLTWDTDPGTWDEEITFWDDQQGLMETPIPVFGYKDGFVDRLNTNVVDDRGVAVSSGIDTRDYTGIVHKGIEFDTEWMQFDLWARGYGSVTLWYSTDYGSTWKSIGTKTLTPFSDKITWYFHFIAPHVRFRFRCDGKGEYMTMRNCTPYYLDQPEMTG